ncbi:MAG: FliH/SctL family protein [Paenibacillaceae bacterium]
MSNLIKSNFYLSQEDIKTIKANKLEKDIQKISIELASLEMDHTSHHDFTSQLEEAQMLKDQILQDAELAAEQVINQAKQEVQKLKNQALSEIEAWWEERRQQDQEIIEQSRQSGYQTGFDEGTIAAELQVNEKYTGMFIEAQSILEQSYEMYRKTILDAEIFLLEMSCGIAEKIISKKLDQSTDWIIDMVKQALQRSSEKGTIAICVAPAQFAYIQSVREELSYTIDPQAELHIYPDASIKDYGCVIKTNFGTIDARVETQLTEIKQALLDIARRGDESVEQ